MFILKTVSPRATPLLFNLFSMDKQAGEKIILKEGIVSIYARVKSPITCRTLKLALDTGATYTMVPAEILRDIGYDPALSKKRIEISTANGLVLSPLVTVSQISSLGITVKNIKVVCHSLPPESPVVGLLGLNFLVHLPAFIEFYRKIRSLV